MTELTLHLREEIAKRASEMAALAGQGVEEYLAGIVEENIAEDPDAELKQMASFSDEDVLALADLRLTEDEDRRLHELLELNREGQLAPQERRELDELMRLHDEGMLKKALGWAEAVRRNLRQPITP
jgi:hypothetical protein